MSNLPSDHSASLKVSTHNVLRYLSVVILLLTVHTTVILADEQSDASVTVDTTITGGGPAGMALALELALRGQNVHIIESRRQRTRNLQAVAIKSSIVEHLLTLGVNVGVPLVLPDRVAASITWSMNELDEDKFSTTVYIADLERSMESAIRSFSGPGSIQWSRPAEIKSMTETAGGLKIIVSEAPEGAEDVVKERTIYTGHLSIAEGSRSTVADRMGIPSTREDTPTKIRFAMFITNDERFAHYPLDYDAYSLTIDDQEIIGIELPKELEENELESYIKSRLIRDGLPKSIAAVSLSISTPFIVEAKRQILTSGLSARYSMVGDVTGTTHPQTGLGLNAGIAEASLAAIAIQTGDFKALEKFQSYKWAFFTGPSETLDRTVSG